MNKNIRFNMPLTGVYNRLVYECPECDFGESDKFKDYIIGFSGGYVICECPKCFTKWHCHDRNNRWGNRIKTLLSKPPNTKG